MVKNKKQFLALCMTGLLAVSSVIPTAAHETSNDEQLVEVSEEAAAEEEPADETKEEAETEEESVADTKEELEDEETEETVETESEQDEAETEETEVETEEEIAAIEEVSLLAADDDVHSEYRMKDLELKANWGMDITTNEDGSITYNAPGQYKAVCYAIPDSIDKKKLSKIKVKVKDGEVGNICLKVGSTVMEQDQALVYGNNEVAITGDKSAKNLVYFSIMSLYKDPSSFTLDDIEFEFEANRSDAKEYKENEAGFKFSDLEQVSAGGCETEENEDGSTTFTFEKEYKYVTYKIPDSVDKKMLEKVYVSIKEGDKKNLSLKIQNQVNNDDKAICYNNSVVEIKNGTAVEEINYFTIMKCFDTDPTITLEDVVFVYKEVEPELQLAEGYAKPADQNNPIVTQRYSADPGVMVYNDTVYVYSTNDVYEYDNKGKIKKNSYSTIDTLNCFSSKDMVNWTDNGVIQAAGSSGAAKWAKNSWAPCAAHKTIDGKEKFFLYFADNGGGIGVLTSDSPTGPWVDPLGHGLITKSTPNCGNVEWLFDPAVLVDDDGTGYLYFGGGVPTGKESDPGTARVVQLGDDMISIVGTPKQINPPYLFEDSGIHKVGEKYYYTYCSNFNCDGVKFQSGTIQAMVSDSPMGPFEYVGPIFDNPGKFFAGDGGNNHHMFFEFQDRLYLAYHARNVEVHKIGSHQDYRTTQIDEVTVNSDGTMEKVTGTLKGIEQLETLDPYKTVSASTIARELGIEVKGCGDTTVLGEEGEWIGVKGVEFSEGLSKIKVTAKVDEATVMEVRKGGEDGEVIATIQLDNADGEFHSYEVETVSIEGEEDIYFVFGGDVEFESWKAFKAEKSSVKEPEKKPEKSSSSKKKHKSSKKSSTKTTSQTTTIKEEKTALAATPVIMTSGNAAAQVMKVPTTLPAFDNYEIKLTGVETSAISFSVDAINALRPVFVFKKNLDGTYAFSGIYQVDVTGTINIPEAEVTSDMMLYVQK